MSSIIRQEDIKADFHTHTIASLHAYSTLKENIDAAKALGQQYIAVTEHFNGIGDALSINNEIARTNCIEERTKKLEGFRVIGGIELNLGQQNEFISSIKGVNVRIGGIHDWYWSVKHQDIESLKRTVKDYIDRGYINVMAHPERSIDVLSNGKYGTHLTPAVKEYYQWLIEYTKKKRVFIELNEYSAENDVGGSRERMEYIVKLARDNNNPITLGSDAHFYTEVGLFPSVIKLLNKVGYQKELILNCNTSMIETIFPKPYIEEEEIEADEESIL